ncbi:putative membrane protein [Motilibacter rhizosphaerae]|uniref:Putative membrane protein n=1 Tax=Motilibacter rhizosphaerae TaxID=598652 RepID=A0A4Q7NSY9_9ACTN|nr:DUF4142 domain-containing protein [Motilibacter rhizosphaerae]RZS90263.1 putative membrane protein [Motilibacter rhizosphaerae]
MKARTLVPALATAAVLAAAPAAASAAEVSTQATAAQAKATDAAWLKAAAAYDLAEISAGKLAESKATTAAVAGLGKMFVMDHTKHIAMVRSLAKARGVTLPTTPPADAAKRTAELADAPSGITWDRNWVRFQLSGHRAVYIATGKARLVSRDSGVLNLERMTLPVVKKHYLGLAATYVVIAPPAS